jgi:hypothetical protein
MESTLEQWRQTHDPNYMVSNFGRVKSLDRQVKCGPKGKNAHRTHKGQILTPFLSHSTEYFQVNLSNRKRFNLHRLVAMAFCSGFQESAVVNHKNGIKGDNRAENLEWVSQAENNIHAFRVLKRKPTYLGKFGKEHSASKKISMRSIETGEIEYFDCGMDAIRKYPFLSSGSISRCAQGQIRHHKGYVFRYVVDKVDRP